MEQTAYYQNKLNDLKSAVSSLGQVLAVDLAAMSSFERDVYRNAAVQKFEYSIELFWKVAKLYLNLEKGIDELSPKPVIKAFFRETALKQQEYEALLEMIEHRNLLSHLYNKERFEHIQEFLPQHIKVLQNILRLFPEEISR